MINPADVDDRLGARRHGAGEIDAILRTDEDERIRESDGGDEEKGHVDLWVNLLEFPADNPAITLERIKISKIRTSVHMLWTVHLYLAYQIKLFLLLMTY